MAAEEEQHQQQGIRRQRHEHRQRQVLHELREHGGRVGCDIDGARQHIALPSGGIAARILFDVGRKADDRRLGPHHPRSGDDLVHFALLRGRQQRFQGRGVGGARLVDFHPHGGWPALLHGFSIQPPRAEVVEREQEKEEDAGEEIEAHRRHVAGAAIARELARQFARAQEQRRQRAANARIELEGLLQDIAEQRRQRADVVAVVLPALGAEAGVAGMAAVGARMRCGRGTRLGRRCRIAAGLSCGGHRGTARRPCAAPWAAPALARR